MLFLELRRDKRSDLGEHRAILNTLAFLRAGTAWQRDPETGSEKEMR